MADLELAYTAHSVDPDSPIEVEAMLEDGTKVTATVRGYVAELTRDGSDASYTLRERGECPFEVGDKVTVTVSITKADQA